MRLRKSNHFENSNHSPKTKGQQTFKKLNYFPVSDKYKFKVTLKEFNQQTPIKMKTSKGDEQDYTKYAHVEFQVEED